MACSISYEEEGARDQDLRKRGNWTFKAVDTAHSQQLQLNGIVPDQGKTARREEIRKNFTEKKVSSRGKGEASLPRWERENEGLHHREAHRGELGVRECPTISGGIGKSLSIDSERREGGENTAILLWGGSHLAAPARRIHFDT